MVFQLSLGSKRDLNPKDFLSRSIISAVTRKRKKSPSTNRQGSSADEDSEHEPVKSSNYRGRSGGDEEEGEEEEEDEGADENKVKDQKDKGVEERSLEQTDGISRTGADVRKERWQRTTLPGPGPRPLPQPRSHSFLYSHHQVQAVHPRPPTLPHLTRGHPIVPLWISPTRLSGLYQCPSFQPQLDRNLPVRYRKTRGGRTRAVSMNLDLELGGSDDGVRSWRSERVEVIRVNERTGVPQGSLLGPRSIQGVPEAPPLSSLSSRWMEQNPPGASGVVLRRSGVVPRDKTRAWRRHTVVV